MLIEALKRYVLNDMQYERLIFATYSPMFLIGMLVAKMKNMYRPHSTALLLFLPLLFPIATGVINAYSIFTFLPVIFPCFISLILSSLILFVLSDNKVQECNSSGNNKKNLVGGIIFIFRWLGRYSLEVYLLHTALWSFLTIIFPNNRLYNVIFAEILSLCTCKWISARIKIITSLLEK